jgi:predicted metal-dependent hydrolase
LSPAEQQALADLLPLLICGEETAISVFERLAVALQQQLAPPLLADLQRVAQDEIRHAAYLDRLRAHLPVPTDTMAAQRAAHFLASLRCAAPARQLVRLAALDALVCCVLSAMLRPNARLACARDITLLLRRIQLDEATHVRITRACFIALGVMPTQVAVERAEMQQRFAALLAVSADAFAGLGVDLAVVTRHWKTTIRHGQIGGASA